MTMFAGLSTSTKEGRLHAEPTTDGKATGHALARHGRRFEDARTRSGHPRTQFPRTTLSAGPIFYIAEAGAKGLLPLSPAPQIPADPGPPLRSGQILLDHPEHLLHNHCASVASLRLLFTFAPECRSPSLRNHVRLHRNTQTPWVPCSEPTPTTKKRWKY